MPLGAAEAAARCEKQGIAANNGGKKMTMRLEESERGSRCGIFDRKEIPLTMRLQSS